MNVSYIDVTFFEGGAFFYAKMGEQGGGIGQKVLYLHIGYGAWRWTTKR